MNQEQIDYVRTELARGVDPETLRETLRQSGYGEDHIIALMSEAGAGSAPASAPRSEPTSISPQTTTDPAAQSGVPATAVPEASHTAAGAQTPKKGLSIWIYIAGGLFVLVLALVMSVLASLNTARDSGMDATAMQSLGNLRSQAEIYSAGNDSGYEGLCESTIVASLLETPVGNADCLDSPERFRASVELNSGEYFCVAGVATEGAELPATGRFAAAPTGFSCE